MLTAKKVERTKTPGRYRDGLVRGLYLQISDNGANCASSGTAKSG
jgi:hypothetical protein